MTPEMQWLLAALKDVKTPFSLLFVAVVVGGLVRILKTDTVGGWLDKLPTSWINRIPRASLRWYAIGIAGALTFFDALLNAKMPFGEALGMAVMGGILSGGTAIGGHETVAKSLHKMASTPLQALAYFGAAVFLVFTVACGPFKMPSPQQQGAVVEGTCTIVEAFVQSPLEQMLCATAEELVLIESEVRSTRADAGPMGLTRKTSGKCKIVPSTTVCATDEELAAAIKTRKAARK